ncbi:uncharacterized protein LOC116445167 [Corvus moneduloides]|uniref:uncharacterized protein LOC116445167 n=1 Tax=Corvus moneduloides TaxID=1196302 RepID=UPI001362F693|nr:uncharacterized protein LOC116445167 [Corvus moneduloides]
MPPRRPGPVPGPHRPARAAVAAARTPRPHRGARPRRDPAGGPCSSMRSRRRLVGSGGDGNCRRDSARRPGEPASLARGGAGSRDAGAGRRVRPGSDARSPLRRRGGRERAGTRSGPWDPLAAGPGPGGAGAVGVWVSRRPPTAARQPVPAWQPLQPMRAERGWRSWNRGAVRVNTWGNLEEKQSWEGSQPGQLTRTDQRDIPYHRTLCPA